MCRDHPSQLNLHLPTRLIASRWSDPFNAPLLDGSSFYRLTEDRASASACLFRQITTLKTPIAVSMTPFCFTPRFSYKMDVQTSLRLSNPPLLSLQCWGTCLSWHLQPNALSTKAAIHHVQHQPHHRHWLPILRLTQEMQPPRHPILRAQAESYQGRRRSNVPRSKERWRRTALVKTDGPTLDS